MEKPAAVTWYSVFCIASAIFYLFVVAGGVVYWIAAEEMANGNRGDEMMLKVVGAMFCVFGFAMSLLYTSGLFFQKGNGGWVFGMVLIAISLTGICFIAGVPLLVFWVKPEIKQYFASRA